MGQLIGHQVLAMTGRTVATGGGPWWEFLVPVALGLAVLTFAFVGARRKERGHRRTLGQVWMQHYERQSAHDAAAQEALTKVFEADDGDREVGR